MVVNLKIITGTRRKTRYSLLSAAAILAVAHFGAPSASATNFTWTNFATTNIWSTSDVNWNNSGNVAWTNGAADQAIFSLATPANVSLASAITVIRGVQLNTSGWTISNGGGSLSNSSSKIGFYTGYFDTDTDTVSATIIDSGASHTGLTKAGWGTLTLSGANTYLGTTTVTNGTLRLDASTGSLAATALNLEGGTFIYDNTNSTGAMAQTLGAVTPGASTEGGEGTVINIQGGASSSTLTLASSTLSGSPGSTINFISGGSANTNDEIKITAAIAFNGATFFNGSDYAIKDATGGYLRAPVYGTDATFIAADTSGASTGGLPATANNYLVTTQSIASQASAIAQTIKFNGSGTINVTLATGTTVLTVGNGATVGGLLRAGGGSTTITGPSGASIAIGGNISFRTATSTDFLTIDVPISGASTLVKSGAGTLFMTANAINTYGPTSAGSVGTFINGGILSIVQNGNLGKESLGDLVAINGGTLQANATFGLFNGTVGTNNRSIDLLNDATIDVTSSNTLTVAGVIKDASGNPGRLIKTGAGTLLLTGTTSTYTGGTTIDNGTLKLDANTGVFSTTAVANGNGNFQNVLFVMGGGTFDYDNTNSAAAAKSLSLAATTSALTFVAGDSTVENVQGPLATSSLLTFPSVNVRTPGATGNFVFSNRTALSTTNGIKLTGVAAGFIDQGTFYGGADYAVMNAAGTFVRAPVYGTDTGAGFAFVAADTSGAALADSATSNYLVTTTSIGSQTTGSAKTIKFGGGVNPVNMTLAGGATLTLASGGILVSGNTTTTISGSGGANITAGSNVEFVFRTDVAADNLTIDTPILANGVNVFTKSGAGTLTMTANAVNTYTGGTFIDGGVLSVSQNSNLGDPGTGAAVTINNSTLQATASFGLFNGSAGTNNRAVNLENDATFDVASGQTLTIAGVVASVASYPGHLIKTDTGTLALSAVNTYAGATSITGGKLSIASSGSLNSTTGVSINGATANFNYNGSAAYTQPLSFGASGGTLSGTGTISASGGVTAAASAVVAPGNSPGSLTFTTGLTFNTGSTYLWNNNEGNTAGAAGTEFSSIINSGSTITINDGTLALTFNATTNFTTGLWTNNPHTWDIISGGSVTGSFANINLSGSSLGLINAANTLSQGTFSDAVSGGDLILTWTPNASGPVNATWISTLSTTNGNWSNGTENWSGGTAPSTAGSVANFNGTGTRAAVNVDAPETVGTINLSGSTAYTISGSNLTLDNTGGTGNASINSTTSTAQTISSQVVVANTNLNVNSTGGGALNLAGGIDNTVGNNVTLTASGGSVISLGNSVNSGAVAVNATGGTVLVTGTVTGGGTVTLNGGTFGGHGTIAGALLIGTGSNTIAPSATLTSTSTGTLTVGSLNTANTALQFNLVSPLKSSPNGSDMINVTGSGLLTLGSGTTISVNVDHTTGGPSTLGYYKIMQYTGTLGGSLSNVTLPAAEDSGNVVYTLTTTQTSGFVDIHRGYLGDVDDSGFVDINDLAVLAANWQQPGGWSQGNFLNDTTVDINDLAVLAAHWQTGIASFGSAADSLGGTSESFQDAVSSIVFGGVSQVPEPTSLALLGLGAAGLLARRRR